MKDPILQIEDLRTYFFTRTGTIKAVDQVDLYVREGETLGIVGESGSGKSMTALSILRLVPEPAGRIVSGHIWFEGKDLVGMTEAEMEKIRGPQICMILQDPMTSLNPIYSIGNQLGETVLINHKLARASLAERCIELLTKVKIPAPEMRLGDYPHQMSGGMRQRVAGAIAMSNMPKLLIADEPTTSLDATIQLQYLQLLKEIQVQTGMAIIFITHDFGIVANMCDRVAVMYAGKIIETAEVRELFNNPSHPYTQALIQSIVPLEEDTEFLYSIEGQPPDLGNLPPGCSFAPRCPHAVERCSNEYPPSFKVATGHDARCWLRETADDTAG